MSVLVVAGCGGDDGGSATSDTAPGGATATTIAAGADFDGLAAQVADGTVTVVDGADHEVWRSHGDVGVDAVAEVVAAARGT